MLNTKIIGYNATIMLKFYGKYQLGVSQYCTILKVGKIEAIMSSEDTPFREVSEVYLVSYFDNTDYQRYVFVPAQYIILTDQEVSNF